MRLIKLLSILCLLCSQAFGAYTWRRKITIDHTKVPSTQTNFPVGIAGVYSYLATVANGGKVTSSSGFDILFTSDLAGTLPLTCEQVFYSPTTGGIEYWLNIASLSSSSDTVIYMFYGNSSVTTTRCASPSTVWDSHFKMVLHLPDGTTLSANDSTSNGNNGTIGGSPAATAGSSDGGANFALANNSNFISTGFTMPTTNFTYSFFLSAQAVGGVNDRPFGASDYTGGTFGTGVVWSLSSAIYVIFRQGTNSGVGDINFAYGGSFIGAHYVAVTMDSTLGGQLHLDGSGIVSTNATYKSITTGGNHAWVGRDQNQNVSGFQGWIDEVRISDIVRSADWLTTEFNNQLVISFYTIGPPFASSGSTSFPIVY